METVSHSVKAFAHILVDCEVYRAIPLEVGAPAVTALLQRARRF